MVTGFSRADFVRAVDHLNVNAAEKVYARDFQAAVWDNSGLRWKVESHNGEIEFIEGGQVDGHGEQSKLTADIIIGSTHTPIPHNLLHDQVALLNAINNVRPNYVGAGAYWIESHVYHDNLRLGADVAAMGTGVLNHVYDISLTAEILTTPTA